MASCNDIDEIARRQLADYDAHRPGRTFEDPSFRLTLEQAYEVQNRVAALRVARGEAIAGYKIGCVGEPVQRQLNVSQPVFGHVFATEIHRSGVALDSAGFECLAVEGEVAVRIAEDITDAEGLNPTRVIESAFPIIELHNNVFRGATKTAEELIANNALHAGVVLPLVERALRGAPESISVFRNGEMLGTASGDSIPGGPLASVIRIVRHVVSRGGTIGRGRILLTGSPLPLYSLSPGDRIAVRDGHSVEVSAVVM